MHREVRERTIRSAVDAASLLVAVGPVSGLDHLAESQVPTAWLTQPGNALADDSFGHDAGLFQVGEPVPKCLKVSPRATGRPPWAHADSKGQETALHARAGEHGRSFPVPSPDRAPGLALEPEQPLITSWAVSAPVASMPGQV